jgi:putative endopeptidase
VNGRLTLGENIADLGGLTVAYYAMEKAIANKPHAKIDGFTPEQRFFLGWAQVWRSLARPEQALQSLKTDSHSPNKWRVNGPLSNMPEFKKAFGCSDTDPTSGRKFAGANLVVLRAGSWGAGRSDLAAVDSLSAGQFN